MKAYTLKHEISSCSGAILVPGSIPSLYKQQLATGFLKAKLMMVLKISIVLCPIHDSKWKTTCLSIPFSLFEMSPGKERDHWVKYNLLEYHLLTADILDNRSLWFSQIVTGSKSGSYKVPTLLESIMQTSSWWLWTSPCTYHSLPVLEVSLFQKGCLPQQADRSGSHWGCSVEAY